MSSFCTDGLPPNWAISRLGDVLYIVRGISFPKESKTFIPQEDHIACLRTTNVQREVEWDDLWFVPLRYVKSEAQNVRVFDILISTANSLELVGKVAQIKSLPCQSTLGAFISLLRSSVHTDPRFLYFQLASDEVQSAIRRSASTTTNISNVSTRRLVEIPLNVAPLPEQHRIVAEIEKQFTRLDASVAALKRTQANLKRYRASVLKTACEGKLVPTEAELARQEGRDYEPASALLERILKKRRARWEEQETRRGRYKEPAAPVTSNLPDLPEGWIWATVDAVLLDIRAGKNFKCEERPPKDNESGVVKVSSVTWGEFNELESKTCTDAGRFDEKLVIQEGDFLFSRANTIQLVGACVIVKNINLNLMLSDKILRFHLIGASAAWLLYVLRSAFGRSEIERLATGNQESMRNIG